MSLALFIKSDQTIVRRREGKKATYIQGMASEKEQLFRKCIAAFQSEPTEYKSSKVLRFDSAPPMYITRTILVRNRSEYKTAHLA